MTATGQKAPVSILQVEDEQADIEILAFAFERAGITNPIHAVTDGQEARDYLLGVGPFADRERFPLPGLILLDLKVPRLNGLELLAWLRDQPRLKHIVVIAFSSSAQATDLERAYDVGANSFVQKPSGLEATIHFAKTLKAWWLDLNRFPPANAPV